MKMKKFLFHAIAFLVSIIPLGTYLAINYEYYFMQVDKSYGAGLFLAIVIMLYALKDKFSQIFKNNAQMKISLFLLLIFWCVSKVYEEVILLAFLSFVGSVISIPFAIMARRQGKKIARENQLEITKQAFESVIAISKK